MAVEDRIAELWGKATPKTVERDLEEAVKLFRGLRGTRRYAAQGYIEGLVMLASQVREDQEP